MKGEKNFICIENLCDWSGVLSFDIEDNFILQNDERNEQYNTKAQEYVLLQGTLKRDYILFRRL